MDEAPTTDSHPYSLARVTKLLATPSRASALPTRPCRERLKVRRPRGHPWSLAWVNSSSDRIPSDNSPYPFQSLYNLDCRRIRSQGVGGKRNRGQGRLAASECTPLIV